MGSNCGPENPDSNYGHGNPDSNYGYGNSDSNYGQGNPDSNYVTEIQAVIMSRKSRQELWHFLHQDVTVIPAVVGVFLF